MRLLSGPLRVPAQLRPEPDEARGLLRRELLERQYHDEDLLQRAYAALLRVLDAVAGAAGAASGLSLVAASLVGVVGVVVLVWLLTRLSPAARRRAGDSSPVFPAVRVSAAEHRRLAEAALADGDLDTVVVEAFRAAVLRAVEDGRVADSPGATASEVAEQVPEQQRAAARVVAGDFDRVRYGHRPADRDAAARALALDDLARDDVARGVLR